jgi:Ataxin-1 and HBP1 module (AXH)
MKNLASISLLFLIIFSCSKTHDYLKIDCSDYPVIPSQVSCNGSICQSDTCKTYLGIWKELFLSKNQMTEEYFDNHISICNTATYKYANQGIQFELAYKLTIDWFETTFEEGFMIWLLPSYLQSNPTVNLPGNTLLSKNQISANINNPFFGYAIHDISSINHLNYSSRQEAIRTMAHAAGVNDLCSSTLSVQYQNVDNPAIGHPILSASTTLNLEENKCVSGIMDLATDYVKVQEQVCIIWFCFVNGTKITLNDKLEKSIEKMKPGDRILSLNQNTMKIEEDIVKQIDSVKHSDIVHISFNDMTVNHNTSDHPYYVKNKGWCSCKPDLTLKKYNIQAKQLLAGDTCFKYKDKQLIEVRIKNITENPGEVMTYNISRLERNKSYFANGILVSTEDN